VVRGSRLHRRANRSKKVEIYLKNQKMIKDSKDTLPLTKAPTDSGRGAAITDIKTGKLETECKDYEDYGTKIWEELTDFEIEINRMEKILCVMDEFQKANKNVHKPQKYWIAKLEVLTAKVSPMKKQLRSTCEKISEEVDRLHHIAPGMRKCP
jgi:hypothetical protein